MKTFQDNLISAGTFQATTIASSSSAGTWRETKSPFANMGAAGISRQITLDVKKVKGILSY